MKVHHGTLSQSTPTMDDPVKLRVFAKKLRANSFGTMDSGFARSCHRKLFPFSGLANKEIVHPLVPKDKAHHSQNLEQK